MKTLDSRIDIQRAKNIGRLLFHKYDTSKKGYLEPKHCFQLFSDYCYRILNFQTPPSLEDSQSMFYVLDHNQDQKVTQADFQSLAVKFLCGNQNYSNFNSNYTRSSSSFPVQPKKPQKIYTNTARNRLDVIRRLFKKYDQDANGYLTQQQIPFILRDTYLQMGYSNYVPSKQDVKSYMKMVDTNQDGRVTLQQFENIVLKSLQKAGIQIYQ